MTQEPKQLVGSVLERKPGPRTSGSGASNSKPMSRFAQSQASGFPAAQHRSQSAFARGRTANLERSSRPPGVAASHAIPVPSSSSAESKVSENEEGSVDWRKKASEDEDGWRKQMDEENARRVEQMSDAERAQERLDILSRFGPGVGDILRRAREKREKENVTKIVMNPEQVEKAEEPDLVEVARRARSRSPPAPILSRSGSRASSPTPVRPGRRIRFSDAPTPVHVYESQPPSPKRRALALPAPTGDDEGVVSLGTFKGTMSMPLSNGSDATEESSGSAAQSSTGGTSTNVAAQEPEEGTPEDIRRRFFPHLPANANDASLEWMSDLPSTTDLSNGTDELRFDLTGTPLSSALAQSLPTHLGLHHHADNAARAGYTLSDVLVLSRSTAPAQRAAMLAVLTKIVHRVGELHRGTDIGHDEDGLSTLLGKQEDIRARALAAGAAALSPTGGVAARAVDVLWECIVGWDPELADLRGIELRAPPPADSLDTDPVSPLIKDALASLPLLDFFEQAATVFAAGALPPPTLLRLLAVVRHLARQSSRSASTAAHTPTLIQTILRALILTPSTSLDDVAAQPAPEAIATFTVLAEMSRDAAESLRAAADALLRFVAIPPSHSAYPRPLADALLEETLRFYTVLASYGFGARLASTAQEPLSRLAGCIASPSAPTTVRASYANLLERWITCAVDPHATTPPHDIRWSQVVAWGWADELKALARAMAESAAFDGVSREAWVAVFNANAAYLEGARINGERGGVDERRDAMEGADGLKESFNAGVAQKVVTQALDIFSQALDQMEEVTTAVPPRSQLQEMSATAEVLAAVLRLWLVSHSPEHPPTSESTAAPNSSSSTQDKSTLPAEAPFSLPFLTLDRLALRLARSSLLAKCHDPKAPAYAHVYGRHLSAFLAKYALAARRIAGVAVTTIRANDGNTEDVLSLDDGAWLALALSVLPNLGPGDEHAARELVAHVLGTVTPEFLMSKDLPAPPEIWARGGPYKGMNVLKPFIVPDVSGGMSSEEEGDEEAGREPIIAPLTPTPRSIKTATTHVLPAPWTFARRRAIASLPLARDWPLLPLEHLLRSGASPVFASGGLPPDWDAGAGEPELVRAALLLARVARGALVSNGSGELAMSRAEVVFGCMRVFMLEHGTKGGVPVEEGGEGEVFRDTVVTRLMEELLAPYSLGRSPTGLDVTPAHTESGQDGEEGPALEVAAVRYLGTGTPFYQFYTDFVALYDSLSLGHATFGALLIPCLSQAYATDYRRLLYADHAQALAAIRTLPQQIPAARVGSFLWPVEQDAQILGAQLALLVGKSGRGVLSGVLRWLVVHHVAASIWPDLREDATGEERSRKMLQAIVDQGRFEDVREVCGYWQQRVGNAVTPEECFSAASADVRGKRSEWVRSWAGEAVIDRLTGLLDTGASR
ncbi:hypothetical protein PENSPDRAFT_754551 [Peniophora sp. CONT]|nr:hypothetical protein PENSPDRAFT_754551 [Peniophora sp. CONT]